MNPTKESMKGSDVPSRSGIPAYKGLNDPTINSPEGWKKESRFKTKRMRKQK